MNQVRDPLPAAYLRTQGFVPVRAVYGIGRNYAAHAREMNSPVPREPVVFLKATTSLIQDGGTVILPPESRDVQHEVEIVVLLGKSGRHLSREEARGLIAGYGIGIDVTARDLQRQAQASGNPWTIAKGFDTFGPISHFLPASSLNEPTNLEFDLSVNGHLRQSGNSQDMLFGFAEILAHLSRLFTLNAGDLIFTGTPEGVAQIRAGDCMCARLLHHDLTLTVQVATTEGR